MHLKSIKYSDIEKYPSYFKLSQNLKEDFFGSSPSVFIGRFGYPDVNVGLLAPQETSEQAWLHDAPRFWAQQDYQIEQVADLRLSLINARSKSNIKKQERINELAKLVALSTKPVDLEIHLKKKPTIDPLTDRIITPMGPAAPIKSAEITENPKIPHKIDKVTDDTDLKASDALTYLYNNDFDENILSRVLSVGALGIGKNRRLVPTRWSITATDSTLANALLKEIKTNSNHLEYSLYSGSYLGNYYYILCFPDIWSYELYETYLPRSITPTQADISFSTDYEPFNGSTSYAENCAGGFYTVRLALAEKLRELKRQASILVLRFITDEYKMPLGVWVTREAARKALSSTPITFASKELLLGYLHALILKRFGFDTDLLTSKSILLNQMKQQTKLTAFTAYGRGLSR